MKISNKILAATSMLLVSVIMLGTATYAWFAMNTRSVANGLTVEAYSDSNFLEIRSNEDNTFGINTTFQDASGLLRLVTPKFMKNGEIVTLSVTAPTDTYYDGTGTYYKKGDSDIGAGTNYNYLYVDPSELVASTSTANLYMDLVFVVETSDKPVNTNGDKTQYYEFSKNVYTGVALNNESAKGLYKVGYYAKASATYVDGTTYYSKTNGKFTKLAIDNSFDTSNMSSYYVIVTGNIPNTGAAYDGVSAFFKNIGDASSPVYERVSDITYGTELAEYYVVDETVVDMANNPTSDGQSVYYLKNDIKDSQGNILYTDYSYIGVLPSGTILANYLYWGRAYSNDPTKVQENNTLNIINPNGTDDDAVTNYYLAKTLYLRQAEGTNNASNLRIEDVRIGGAKNELSNALRVLFVAYSEHDPDTLVTYIYDHENDNENGNSAESEVLFSTLLGNEAETITVEVYVYFDGTDTDANNAQVAGAVLNGQTIEIEFAIDELNYN